LGAYENQPLGRAVRDEYLGHLMNVDIELEVEKTPLADNCELEYLIRSSDEKIRDCEREVNKAANIGDAGWERQAKENIAVLQVDEDKLRVHLPKAAHIIGHDARLIPLWPDFADLLNQRDSQAATGDVYVLPFLEARSEVSLRKR
jgi:hypothetical protein